MKERFMIMSEKTKGQLLSEKLTYTKKNAYEKNPEERDEIFSYCEEYKKYLDLGKTARSASREAVKMAQANGFKEYNFGAKVQAGDKYYYVNRDRSLFLFIIGSENIEKGIRIIASHIDSPAIDIRANPVYESGGMAFFRTHYYGGIKKYQWTAIPLALHGIITDKSGKRIDVCIGENDDDPIFYINDLLPHLAQEQCAKSLRDGVDGEMLNIVLGSIPYDDEAVNDKIKLNVLAILNEKYGITEEDFLSAELTIVPALKAKDVGLDRSLIASYGHDDRVCAYPSLTALFSLQSPEHTVMAVLADKEETGSNGVTGMKGSALDDIITDISVSMGKNERLVRANSMCLSADVCAAYDPNFANAFEKNNSAIVGCGIGLAKYTGARGKSDTNDATGEYTARIARIFNENGVVWQTCEMGKIDFGGGGTVAKFIAERNIDTIDAGVPVISMHAPYELVAKADVYNMHKASKAFFESK